MLRPTHVLLLYFLYIVFHFYGSNTFVTPPPLNRMNNIWNEQNHNIELKFPLFESGDIFKIVVIRFIFILLLFTVFYTCVTFFLWILF